MSNVDKKSAEGEEQVQLCNYTDVYYRDRIDTSIDFMTATAPEHQVRSFGLRTDDVLITKDSESWDDIAVPAVVAEPVDAVCGYHLALLRPEPERVDGRFLGYSINAGPASRHFKVEANGVTRYAIGLRAIGDAPIPAPPLAKQKAVADYLDSETARIDTLIDRKQRFIDLLLEKRTALITHTVTKGLDPGVEMKDSGIAYFGLTPVAWERSKLGRLGRMSGGCTPSKDERRYWGGAIPWVTPKDMKSRCIVGSIDHVTDEALAETGLAFVQPDALLVVVRGMILARMVPVALNSVPVTLNQDMKAVRLAGRVLPGYALLLLEGLSAALMTIVEEAGHGTRCLRTEAWNAFSIMLPPIEEQAAIAEYARREMSKIDALMERTAKSIDLLREYRTALISAAVTGQIDIPGIEASEEVA